LVNFSTLLGQKGSFFAIFGNSQTENGQFWAIFVNFEIENDQFSPILAKFKGKKGHFFQFLVILSGFGLILGEFGLI
jgi:hypothetical protein